jgi:predicted Fe-Mo cluster-binding NifX family protein
MRVGIPAIGKILSENITSNFADAAYYLIYEPRTNEVDCILNCCRNQHDFNGVQAAMVLLDKDVDTVICGEIDAACLDLLTCRGVGVYKGFPATAEEALARLAEGRLKRINRLDGAAGQQEPHSFRFLRGSYTFGGKNILYDDWDFIMEVDQPNDVPSNWVDPVDYAAGVYDLRIDVLEMQPTSKPVAFEFVFFNYPAPEDPERLHRCSFGHYCYFSNPGVYEHLAMVKDMEVTTETSDIRKWDWSRACDSPFILIKPYAQKPFPITVALNVTLYSAR